MFTKTYLPSYLCDSSDVSESSDSSDQKKQKLKNSKNKFHCKKISKKNLDPQTCEKVTFRVSIGQKGFFH